MTVPWVVLKYGGTSVATPERWAAIADRVAACATTHRVWLVVSAVSQVSNRLERALDEAVAGDASTSVAWLTERHEALADGLGLDAADRAPVRALLDELATLLRGVALTAEASPRLRARVLSFGELASTWLGLGALRRAGLDVTRVDARRLLRAEAGPATPDATRYLEARVPTRTAPDGPAAAAGAARVVITQGFIASTADGHTALLGRGGSDTSAALFAALLGADRCEIWTDVHGLFTTDPRLLPSARLLTRLRYREAEELAALGAKVLHPRCLGPVAQARVPLEVRNTADPQGPSTRIEADGDDEPAVLAVVHRQGVPLVSLHTLSMWGQPGYLSRLFGVFATHGISVDLVATSQAALTVTLDHVPGGLGGPAFQAALADLEALGTVTVRPACAVVSMVGRHIRTVLPRLGGSFAAFEERGVHLVSASSEDLNLSFVVDADDAPRLVRDLHAHLLGGGVQAPWLGPSWSELTTPTEAVPARPSPWWVARRDALLSLAADGPVWVQDLAVVRERARALVTALPQIGARFYAMKANDHPDVLRAVVDLGFGLECVSAAEVAHARATCGDAVPLLFTPNFCPVEEYAAAFAAGAEVVLDGPDVLHQAPATFRGRAVGLRLDPGGGQGHHAKVTTAGARTKFGHPIDDVDRVLDAARALDVRIVGLHAHVGSGILEPTAWSRTARTLAGLRARFPDLRWVDLGGGLGVVERPGQVALDLDAVAVALRGVEGLDGLELRIEPGRYLVSEGGVLLLPVTQVRDKGGVTFVGAAAGMDALLRPALYGAWHGIHNLSRWGEPPTIVAEVVGPICETGDVLGHDRVLPITAPGDVLLVENTGAYGHVMGSHYNRRGVVRQVTLG
ncbi:MAG: bifunctional aspartate kinase/diaminopimelate decarboxylase [Alphaproteobacteria bacterium]|nr:bifunctional aspartate kinase/diaminopimelate decarboxylase [Alphaproteobacteria bacterium]